LRTRNGFFFGPAVSQDTGKIRNLGNPAPVRLDFRFNLVNNVGTVSS